MKTLIKAACLLLILFFLAIEISASPQTLVHASDPYVLNERMAYQQEPDYVFVCGIDCLNRNLDVGPIGYDFDYGSHTAYVPQVLANEWHWESQDQALRAGAVAIDTFAHRSVGGCGAMQTTKTLPWYPYTDVPVENSHAQSYWLDASQQTGQNGISSIHRDAVADTSHQRLFRADFTPACAKYFANCGNPTASNSLEPVTLVSISDPASSNSAFPTPTPHLSGMSQNGTHAWELSDHANAAPWDHRQMLTHYYADIHLADSSPYHRWVWLDVTSDIRFNGTYGEDYFGVVANTPTTMYAGLIYTVQIRIQNAGKTTWQHTGSNPIRLAYHWYDSTGANVVVWDGIRTDLGQDVPPTGDVTLNAQVLAPLSPGTYMLKWDMVEEYLTWFSQQANWPTQGITVNVIESHHSYLPAMLKNYP